MFRTFAHFLAVFFFFLTHLLTDLYGCPADLLIDEVLFDVVVKSIQLCLFWHTLYSAKQQDNSYSLFL